MLCNGSYVTVTLKTRWENVTKTLEKLYSNKKAS